MPHYNSFDSFQTKKSKEKKNKAKNKSLEKINIDENFIIDSKQDYAIVMEVKYNNAYILYNGEVIVAKLRKDLREANGEIKVIKNNIIKRALDSNKETGLDDVLEGPTAIVSSTEEYLQPLKAVYKFTKDHENYKIKGGIIEGEIKSVEEILTLAKLPSREELLAKLAGSLLGTISKLAVALDQVKVKKEAEGDSPKAEVAAEVTAE